MAKGRHGLARKPGSEGARRRGGQAEGEGIGGVNEEAPSSSDPRRERPRFGDGAWRVVFTAGYLGTEISWELGGSGK